ncbi:translation initiation factor IF-2, putative [Plasmodium vivax]|uniref:Eukaryotic translation initiation factor 5B n=1 Tax=Plasmodium vivax TaxID=5855 RepID=A0A1G4H0D4_PLAVI|nr:translation initiation factor IF-2, putative [Plasmodium vivax]VUZ97166.1 translation initiation factor IF-2, putative [Plasmodium vivax]
MSKNKKGKKKDDLDAILAEFGIDEKREDEVKEQKEEAGQAGGGGVSGVVSGVAPAGAEENEAAKMSKSKKKKEKLKQKKEQMKGKENEEEGEGGEAKKGPGEQPPGAAADEAVDAVDANDANEDAKKNKKKKKKDKEKANEKKGTSGMSEMAKAAAERLRLLKEYEEKKREEERRKQEEEEERIRKEEEEKEKKRLAKLEKKMQLKKEGKLLSAKAKEEKKKKELYLKTLKESGVLVEPKEKTKAEIISIDLNKTKAFLKKKKNKTNANANVGAGANLNNNAEGGGGTTPQGGKLDESLGQDGAEKKVDPKEIVLDDWEDFLNVDEEGKKEKQPSEQKSGEKADRERNKSKEGKAAEGKAAEGKAAEGKAAEGKAADGKKSPKGEAPSAKKGKKKTDAGKSSGGEKNSHAQGESDGESEYRSAIVCILGHVDTGKTKLLDKLRHTNVQDNEAGGITQQIGATFFPKDILDKQIKKVDESIKCMSKGIMIIDTPGHESFYNLRKRGSSLCDIAILVIDLMHGLEQQTKESIQILKQRNCPFVIALNKIDRLYMWSKSDWSPFNYTFQNQKENTQEEFQDRLKNILNELAEQGLNCHLYWENPNPRKYVSIVPTSAITGEGIADLIMILVKLTQNFMLKNIEYHEKLECTVLEVKNIEGLGTTIDVILTNGVLKESDTIVLCGINGPIVTVIRALLTPQPLKELRIKNEYVHHKSIKACIGVKISANGLEEVLCGTSLFVANNTNEIEDYKKKAMTDVSDVFNHVDKTGVGLYVMASTLGSLEALLIFLKDSKIPVFAVNIGTVQKKDVKKASVMREKGKPEYSVILAFDVKIDPEAEKEAQILGVEIMQKDIIYHLFDAFTSYIKKIEEEKKQSKLTDAIFPCELSIVNDCVFNKKDPIVIGVKVDCGILKIGTPLYIPEKSLKIGNVVSILLNKKTCEKAKKGDEVSIKICGEPHITFGRHFDFNQKIYSKITRESIDVLKEYFRSELTMEDWRLVVQLKKIFNII